MKKTSFAINCESNAILNACDCLGRVIAQVKCQSFLLSVFRWTHFITVSGSVVQCFCMRFNRGSAFDQVREQFTCNCRNLLLLLNCGFADDSLESKWICFFSLFASHSLFVSFLFFSFTWRSLCFAKSSEFSSLSSIFLCRFFHLILFHFFAIFHPSRFIVICLAKQHNWCSSTKTFKRSYTMKTC